MKIGFVGGSYTARSTAVADEECINFFYETTETVSPKMQKYYDGTPMMATYTQPAALFGTPGLKVFATLPTGPVRGQWWTGSRLFVVAGDQLYEVVKDGTFTVVGTLMADEFAASMVSSNIELMVVSAGHAYCYTLSSATWAPNTNYLVGSQIIDPAGNVQTANAQAWAPDTAFALGFQIVDSNGNIQQVTSPGTSGLGAPVWGTSGTTADGDMVWTFQSYANGSAGISGAGIPTFNDSGGTTPDGTGTLIWQERGGPLLDVTDQMSGSPVQVAYSDGYFIASMEGKNQFDISNILDGTTWQGIFTDAVSVFPDDIVSIIVNHRELWVFGSQHCQPYSDTGSSSIFDPIPGALIEMGSGATFGPCLADNSVFWIDQSVRGGRSAWRANGYVPQRISTYAVETDLASYADISGLTSYAYQDQGHVFWVLYVPGAQWSWAYDVAEGIWHKRAAWNAGKATWSAHAGWNHSYAWGMNLVGDWNSGNLYDMSMDYLDDAGTNIRRIRRPPSIENEMSFIYHQQLTIDFETGLGEQPPLLDGNNAPRPPQAMLRWSDNRGKTWSNEHVVGVGFAGEYNVRSVWRRLGRSRYRVYELIVDDPIPWVIIGAYLKTSDDKVKAAA